MLAEQRLYVPGTPSEGSGSGALNPARSFSRRTSVVVLARKRLSVWVYLTSGVSIYYSAAHERSDRWAGPYRTGLANG